MKILNFRHFGIPVQEGELLIQEAQMQALGFETVETGNDFINGNNFAWIKMVNGDDVMIELVEGGNWHMAFTVDEMSPGKYFNVAPSGAHIQFEGAGTMLLEFVKPFKPIKKEKSNG